MVGHCPLEAGILVRVQVSEPRVIAPSDFREGCFGIPHSSRRERAAYPANPCSLRSASYLRGPQKTDIYTASKAGRSARRAKPRLTP